MPKSDKSLDAIIDNNNNKQQLPTKNKIDNKKTVLMRHPRRNYLTVRERQ